MGVRSLYGYAANLLKLAKNDNINVRQTLYNNNKYKCMNIKAIYALVSEALRHWDILEAVLTDSKILIDNPEINEWRARIFITEIFFGLGKDQVNSDDLAVPIVIKYEDEIQQILSSNKVKKLIDNVAPKVIIGVRYARVNTLRLSVTDAIDRLTEAGWSHLLTADSYQGYLAQLSTFEPVSHQIVQDFHVPQLLAFPAGCEVDLLNTLEYGSEIFVMDKSSCLAPLLLNPEKTSCVLDMCAAPGNKTILLASLAKKVYAVERDRKRFEILTKMVCGSSAENVKMIHEDVTKINLLKKRFQRVEYILLDPTCSGSGMRGRQPHATLRSRDHNRLRQLGGFQLTLLRFALTRFPRAKRVVYSTCSLDPEENEQVVQAALGSLYHNFKLVSAAERLPQWVNFGSSDYECGPKCVYADPDTDLTNGFFVAVFERADPVEGQERSDQWSPCEVSGKRNAHRGDEGGGGKQVKKAKKVNPGDEEEFPHQESVHDHDFKGKRDKAPKQDRWLTNKKSKTISQGFASKQIERFEKPNDEWGGKYKFKHSLTKDTLDVGFEETISKTYPEGKKLILKKKSASLKKRIRQNRMKKMLKVGDSKISVKK